MIKNKMQAQSNFTSLSLNLSWAIFNIKGFSTVKDSIMNDQNVFNENDDQNSEMVSFSLIAHAGTARSMAYEALKAAKQNDFTHAEELLKQADSSILEAHHIQTSLLNKEARGEHTKVDVILVHAQDHLMTAILAKELLAEMVELYKKLDASA